VRRLRMLVTVSGSSRPLGCIAAGVSVLLLAAPVAASGSPGKTRARGAASTGAVLGGFTAQNFAVVVEMNKSRQRVARAGVGIRMTCTSGGVFTLPDRYHGLKVSKKGRFSSSFTDTVRNDDGTTTDYAGSVAGTINKARTKAKGTWSLKATLHDVAGAVTDTCDAANITWSAKQ
jgi:hypothetical protein